MLFWKDEFYLALSYSTTYFKNSNNTFGSVILTRVSIVMYDRKKSPHLSNAAVCPSVTSQTTAGNCVTECHTELFPSETGSFFLRSLKNELRIQASWWLFFKAPVFLLLLFCFFKFLSNDEMFLLVLGRIIIDWGSWGWWYQHSNPNTNLISCGSVLLPVEYSIFCRN